MPQPRRSKRQARHSLRSIASATGHSSRKVGRYKRAIELLARADAAQDLRTLYAEAAQTPSPKDEAVLKRIEESETAIGRAEAEIGTIRREMRELAFRRSQIEGERDEFKRRGRDNPYGTFGNEQVLSNVLGGILGGLIQGTRAAGRPQQRLSPAERTLGFRLWRT